MSILELCIISIGLAMDAFAVAICKGLSVKKLNFKHMLIVGGYFGVFQGIMPVIGYLLSVGFEKYITSVDHWIAFILLGLIGANMIKESLGDDENIDCSFTFKAMLPLAIATSIDALAVGVTFAFLNVNIILAVLLIGSITFVLSMIGTKIGNVFGEKFKNKAELIGGIILILMGLKILLEHLNILG
ncbi:MAG: manganese efflux pump [Clostridia bacterium]|nr:manganese efflux pump [Clostridia bacterium]